MSKTLKTSKKRRPEWLAAGTFALVCVVTLIVPDVYAADAADAADQAAVAAVEPATATVAVEATAPAESPEQTIEIFHAGLIDIMKHAKELGFQGRIDELTPLMKRCFDLDFMASKTVGRHWNSLSDEDKLRWAAIFTRFTTANYAGRFTGYTGEEFITVGVEDGARDSRVVMTKIVIPSEDDVELNYRMMKRNGAWKVIDVFLNGSVSELALRRSEYSAALKRNGFEQLLASVETKILHTHTTNDIPPETDVISVTMAKPEVVKTWSSRKCHSPVAIALKIGL